MGKKAKGRFAPAAVHVRSTREKYPNVPKEVHLEVHKRVDHAFKEHRSGHRKYDIHTPEKIKKAFSSKEERKIAIKHLEDDGIKVPFRKKIRLKYFSF